MKLLTVIFLLSIIPNFTLGQKLSNQIEFTPIIRLDGYPKFSYVLSGRPSIDYVKIKGTSFGLSLSYRIPITKSVSLKPGIGYYKYSFNHIKKENTLFGKSLERDINFLSPVYILFFTDKYRYNTITANIGLENFFNCKRDIQIVTGINWNNYFAISEYYHLVYNPQGSQDYLKNYKRYFGSSVCINISLLKKFQKVSIGPSLILPVFDNWKMDETFPEETNSSSRSKWLNGIGLGISINYSLAKKRK
ncbi:MAG: hypothetical protein ABI550_06565 [Ignavibacteriaceae bacterium]